MQLSVIIVNYNVPCFLEQCLLSVRKAMKGLTAEVFVVDNFSTDDSISWLAPRFPWVHFILNNQNEGFAKANNRALSRCKGENILFLNPDTLVAENLFHQCLGYLEAHSLVGAVGVRMIDGQGRYLPESKRSFPTPRASFFKMAGLSALFPHSSLLNEYALGHLDEFVTTRVPVLAGACMMVRASLVNQLKGFDENFFMYGEDIDLSYRIEEFGFENHYFAETLLMHFKGESSQKGSMIYLKHFYGAMLIFVNKHYDKTATGIFPYLLRYAIATRAFFSVLMNTGLLKKSAATALKFKGKTLIVGEQAAFEEVVTMLQQYLPGGLQPEWVALQQTGNDAVSTIADLPGLLREQSVGQLIFCEGAITMADILQLTQQLPSTYAKFLFKLAGSDSIIGSRISIRRN